jgi:nucleoside-diphosphate-sugar epimerase
VSVLITGASGFVGKYAIQPLNEKFEITTVSLRNTKVDQIDFSKIDTILHLAGKAHQMEEIAPDEYFKVNHRLTLSLAKRAKVAGVNHFVFISSVKVYGDINNQILDEQTECLPTDPYGKSKLAAELDLLKLNDQKFIVSIVRPPLVYGPEVKGNLERLYGLINKLPFLPFGGIQNERSMVFVGNLTALIIKVVESRKQGIFIAGDQSRKSTSALVDTIMQHMQIKKPNIVLPKLFKIGIKFLKPNLYSRLFESYIIDNQKTNDLLNFTPPYSFEEGIKMMVDSFNLKK